MDYAYFYGAPVDDLTAAEMAARKRVDAERERAACGAVGAAVNANSSPARYDYAYFYGAPVDDYT